MKNTSWALGAAAFLLLGSRLALSDDSADNTAVITRMTLVMGATLIPAFFVLWRNGGGVNWREFFAAPDPIVVVLSGVAGLAIWPAAWWLMSIVNKTLYDLLGPFTPPTLFLPNSRNAIWTSYVLSEVVFIPLALGVLIWGVAQRQWSRLWVGSLILGGVFGFIGIIVYGQGIAGFFGYGLCGVIAAIVSLRSQSLWAGFATHATFMYANLGLNGELTKRVSEVTTLEPKPFLGQDWLTLLLVGGLVCLVALQVLRFRTETDVAQPKTPQQKKAWIVLLAFLIAASVVGYDEIRERADREPLQADLQSAQNPHE
ncbi:MAG: hypothetical protein DPW16_00835 [Chloroflexi bacterium]|nr:hypothetical protein [Chloroflexota bacterium]